MENNVNKIFKLVQKFLKNPPVIVWGSGAAFPLDGPGYIGVNLEYGYEFRRNRAFSFGWNTFHSIGQTSSYKSHGWGFGNAIGVFGRVKLKKRISVPIQVGLSHNNPFETVMVELANNMNFGPYIHIGIRYDWP